MSNDPDAEDSVITLPAAALGSLLQSYHYTIMQLHKTTAENEKLTLENSQLKDKLQASRALNATPHRLIEPFECELELNTQ